MSKSARGAGDAQPSSPRWEAHARIDPPVAGKPNAAKPAGYATDRPSGDGWLTNELMGILEDGFSQIKKKKKEPERANRAASEPVNPRQPAALPVELPLVLPKIRLAKGGSQLGGRSAKGSVKEGSAFGTARGSERAGVDDDDVLIAALREHMRPASQSTLRSGLSERTRRDKPEGSARGSSKSERGSRRSEGVSWAKADAAPRHAPGGGGDPPSQRSLGGEEDAGRKERDAGHDERLRPGGASVITPGMNITMNGLKRQGKQPWEKEDLVEQVRPMHPILRRRAQWNKVKDDLNRSLRIPVDTYALRRVQQSVPPRLVAN